jgi:type IV secretory pathway TraG/TraD family ATPase VirD4
MGNCNVRFVFRQDDPNDAEAWSRFFGTKRVIKKTFQTQDGQQTGAASNREVLEFRISPDRIKELGVGQCVFSMKTPSVLKELKIPKPEAGFPKSHHGPVHREETRFTVTKSSGFESVAQRFQGIERTKSIPATQAKSAPLKAKAGPISTGRIE